MAYPFAPMPTLGDFIKNSIDKYDAKLRQSKISLEGPDGSHYPKFLICVHDNNQYHAVLPDLDDDEVLNSHILRKLCLRLGIPLEDYGLILTDEGWEEVDIG